MSTERVYLVNYGQTESNCLEEPKRFDSKLAAIGDAASAVRDLGLESWASVERQDFGDPLNRVQIAAWRRGRRVSADALEDAALLVEEEDDE
jgi:hypothetical protein